MIKNILKKELVMSKENNDDFKYSTKCWIIVISLENIKGSTHRDCNINLKLNHKIPVVFHNLKNYDSHLIMQELGNFNHKLNVIPTVLEKYMSFTINNKLSLIDSFQFISSSLYFS